MLRIDASRRSIFGRSDLGLGGKARNDPCLNTATRTPSQSDRSSQRHRHHRTHLELIEETDAALAYRQRDGIFEAMVTRYTLDPTESGTAVTAETEFAIDVALVGKRLDATVIERQRRRELEQQFDWLEREADGQTE